MEYIHHYHSPLGGITVASDGEVLTGLWFDGQKYFAVTLAKEHEEKMLPVFEETDRWLDIYFQGKSRIFFHRCLLLVALNSGRKCGKFFCRFPMENHDLRRNCGMYRKTAGTYPDVSTGSGRCGWS